MNAMSLPPRYGPKRAVGIMIINIEGQFIELTLLQIMRKNHLDK